MPQSELQAPVLKQREIGFRGPHHDGDQAAGACVFVAELPGVLSAAHRHAACLSVTYDLRFICLKVLRRHLQLAGFHLDASLLTKLKVALTEYAEENERESLGLGDCPMPQQAFAPTVDQLASCQRFVRHIKPTEHGDDPWRHYL
ncbi:hypothetical protein [Halothiobacillus sp. DCM-1]|uniref:hypothetical protein n=1 Tax=Halothiobacillus sp. DCM-1 TaxID=3112558 RepID=UPI0032437D29